MGVMALTPEQIRDWLVSSCERQGVPVTITDPRIVADVAVLLSGRAPRPPAGGTGGQSRQTGETRSGSKA